MPYADYGEGRRVPDEVIADQEAHAETVHEMQTDGSVDEMQDESSAVGRGKWLVLLLGVLGVAGLLALLYWIVTSLMGL